MSISPITPEIDSGTTDEQPYTVHKERADQGGNQYLRCKDCQREVIGDDFERLVHAPNCRHRRRP